MTTPPEHIFLTHSVAHFLISIEGGTYIITSSSSSPPPLLFPSLSLFLSPCPLVSVQNNLIPGEDLSGGWEKEMCVEVVGVVGVRGEEREGDNTAQHNIPQPLHYFLTGFGPITRRTEIMCADRSLLLWNHYGVCAPANLFVAPQRSSSTAVRGAGTANREKEGRLTAPQLGWMKTDKVNRRGGTMGGVQKTSCKKCRTKNTLLHGRNNERQGYLQPLNAERWNKKINPSHKLWRVEG